MRSVGRNHLLLRISVRRDIGARQTHDLNNALQNREQMLDALLRSSSEIRYWMSADWRVMLELSSNKLLSDGKTSDGNWIEKYIPVDERLVLRAAIERALRLRSTCKLEHMTYLADGSVGWVSSRAVPLLNEDSDIVEWFGAASNITDRKQAELASRNRDISLEIEVADRTAQLHLYGEFVYSSAAPICAFDRDYRLIAFNKAHSNEFFKISVIASELRSIVARSSPNS